MEGYWGQTPEDTTLPWPLPNPHSRWSEKHAFLRKIKIVEEQLKAKGDFIRYGGMAPSRIEPGEMVGSGEYDDRINGLVWPEGYAEHYVDKHGVSPSQEFFEYIADFQTGKHIRSLSDWKRRWAQRRRINNIVSVQNHRS